MSEEKRFIRGFAWHLIADWLLQNDWMANTKSDLNGLGAWIHGAIHFVAMTFVFRVPIAFMLAITHMLIDTRKPLVWWRKTYHQTTIDMNEHAGWHVAIWSDQVVHIVCIALVAWLESDE